jgi:hypothetical protein
VPILVWRLLQSLFGIGSYWPYLATMLAVNVGIVLAVRQLCRRVGAHEWTTTLVCAVLLVLGAGWENIVFAIQLTYNLSILAFLVHLLLSDHDGPVDRRDLAGVLVGAIGVMSSGFGPIFIVGIALFHALRRRWLAMAVAAAPLATLWGVWFLTHGDDPASEARPGGRGQLPRFVMRGVTAVFDGLTSIPSLGGVALLASLAVLCWLGWRRREAVLLLTLAATTVVMFTAIGFQRVGFGIESAAASRYVFMGAVLLAPLFALTVDQLGKVTPPAAWAGRIVVAASALLNVGWLASYASDWADRSAEQRLAFELVAGSPAASSTDPSVTPVPFSPDVTIGDIPWLVAEGAITPRPVASAVEQALLDAALAGMAGVPAP